MSDLPDYIRRARSLTDYEVRRLDLVQCREVIHALKHQLSEATGQNQTQRISSFLTACRLELKAQATTQQQKKWLNQGLRPTEIKVFAALLKVSPRYLTREQILDAVYDVVKSEEIQPKIIDVFVCRMRPLVQALGYKLSTVWGEGRFIEREIADRFREDLTRYEIDGTLPKIDWALAENLGKSWQ